MINRTVLETGGTQYHCKNIVQSVDYFGDETGNKKLHFTLLYTATGIRAGQSGF
jgi:hypothetical protein